MHDIKRPFLNGGCDCYLMSSDLNPLKFSKQRFLFLDGLRGIAAVYVMLFHFYSILKEKTGFQFFAPLDFFLLEGHVGVQIFFVLSGFVIAYSVHRQQIDASFIGRFFLRRSLRLDPPYWIALLTTVLVSFFSVTFFSKPFHTLPNAKDVLINGFYMQDFLQTERIIFVSWTLCLEIQLYLFFVLGLGVLFWIHRSLKLDTEKMEESLVFIGSFLFLFIFSLAQGSGILTPTISGLFIPYWYNFFMGVILSWIYLQKLQERYFWICCLLMLIILMLAPSKQLGETLGISLGLMWILKNDLMQRLAHPIFQYLGKISYSLYLTHWLLGGKLMDSLSRRVEGELDSIGAGILLGLGLLVAFLTAHYFYKWIELPSLKWSQSLKKTNETYGTLKNQEPDLI